MLSCPMTVVDGTALRDVDDASVMVKLDPQCSKDPLKTCRTKPGNVSRTLRLTSTLSQGVEFDGDVGDQADVRRVVKASDGVYVQLRIGRITSDKLTVSAARLELDSTIVASASARIFQLPQPRVALELVGHGKIDFVPTNRAAAVTMAAASPIGRFVPLPVAGAYSVLTEAGTTQLRAEDGAARAGSPSSTASSCGSRT